MGTFTIQNIAKLPKARRPSRSSDSSGGSRNSLTSARSAASGMSELELDNFRSMRGKSAGNFLDSAYSMVDDVFDLDDRLADVRRRGELQRRVVDANNQAYAILVTATDVRLQHNDDRGNYHYNHFGSEKPAKHARARGERRDPERVRERWRIVDDDETQHVFAHITPRRVTINHRDGTWVVCRVGGRVLELEDSPHCRPTTKTSLAGDTLPTRRKKKDDRTKTFRLYGDNSDLTDGNTGSPPSEVLLAANTPGERNAAGQYPKAHQSYYHDL